MKKRVAVLCLGFVLFQSLMLYQVKGGGTGCSLVLSSEATFCIARYLACRSNSGATCALELAGCLRTAVSNFGACLVVCLQPRQNPYQLSACVEDCNGERDKCISAGCPEPECQAAGFDCMGVCHEAYGAIWETGGYPQEEF